MRLTLVAAAVIAACVVGAALADETPTTQQATIHWDEMPDAHDFARLYPRRARNQNVAGYGLLCCSVRPDRRLNCEVLFEWPRDYGFAEATSGIAEKFLMSEASYVETQSMPDYRVRRGIVWQMGPRSSELQAALTQIYEGTRDMCRTPVSTGDPATTVAPQNQ